ncbi:hypothetical protein [Paucibacter sp. M5-1]|uniref:hypothetical protein n=1 Tax=Paucibacter sp. M5-1 TaxID=3015998 RepID=UPI0022B8BBAE|nr:hypothetical protein [Paucibacter sp. M5-1]MCZ7880514.1 hypothetical protein [Paucibacter sp. M5-1]MCZ7880559.1 hypothetical protein [Paucibacter sp. M5-1]
MIEVPSELLEQGRILEAKGICGQGGIDLFARDEQGPPLGEDVALHATGCAGGYAGGHGVQAVAWAALAAFTGSVVGVRLAVVVAGPMHDHLLPGGAVRAMPGLRLEC